MPRAQGSTTLQPGDRAPRAALPTAADPGQTLDIPAAGAWQLLLFLRHPW